MERANEEQKQGLDPTQTKAKDLMVKQAMSLLLREDTAEHIVNKAKNGDPKAAVVDAVVPLLTQIHQMASVAGAKVEMVTVLVAGIEIVAVMAKMLEAAEVLTEEEIPNFCADAAKEAVERHNAQVVKGAMRSRTAATPPQGEQLAGGMMGAPVQPQGA